MTELFDHRQVRRSFSRAAQHYDSAAALQREVGARLSESLDYYLDASRNAPVPQVIVDLGCGRGEWLQLMRNTDRGVLAGVHRLSGQIDDGLAVPFRYQPPR